MWRSTYTYVWSLELFSKLSVGVRYVVLIARFISLMVIGNIGELIFFDYRTCETTVRFKLITLTALRKINRYGMR